MTRRRFQRDQTVRVRQNAGARWRCRNLGFKVNDLGRGGRGAQGTRRGRRQRDVIRNPDFGVVSLFQDICPTARCIDSCAPRVATNRDRHACACLHPTREGYTIRRFFITQRHHVVAVHGPKGNRWRACCDRHHDRSGANADLTHGIGCLGGQCLRPICQFGRWRQTPASCGGGDSFANHFGAATCCAVNRDFGQWFCGTFQDGCGGRNSRRSRRNGRLTNRGRNIDGKRGRNRTNAATKIGNRRNIMCSIGKCRGQGIAPLTLCIRGHNSARVIRRRGPIDKDLNRCTSITGAFDDRLCLTRCMIKWTTRVIVQAHKNRRRHSAKIDNKILLIGLKDSPEVPRSVQTHNTNLMRATRQKAVVIGTLKRPRAICLRSRRPQKGACGQIVYPHFAKGQGTFTR